MTRLNTVFLSTLLLIGLWTSAAFAYDIPGLRPGVEIPVIAAPDQNGKPQNWDSLRGEKGAVLFFVRSADWCPFCQIQLIDLQNRLSDLQDKGYNAFTISYDSVDSLKQFSTRYKTDFTMLSDPDSDIIRAFGILNETVEIDSTMFGIPHPVIYVINRDGIIRQHFGEESYRKRPPIDVILEYLGHR